MSSNIITIAIRGLAKPYRYALAADIQTIPGLPTAPGYLNVDVDPESGEIDGLF